MIKILDKNVAAKIAAGEVVDKPLSVVKELIENSIDAGASNITLEIKNGGKSYIRVTDNGCGISKDEVEIAFARHATSKISDERDLDNILTLGFRGEALASIAAVSKIELLTKSRDDKFGIRLILSGGDILSKESYGCPDGTTIIVKDLFFNTPARLKFLKTDIGETSPIIELVSQLAIAYPNIKFTLKNSEKIVFSTLGNNDLKTAIQTVYKNQGNESLIKVSFLDEYVKITGYVSSPEYSKNSRKGQIFFVNGRIVNSNVIEKGINLAYAQRLFDGRYPIAYLFLDLTPDKLDVNIHPNKREVRFDNPEHIATAVEKAITNALTVKKAIPQIHYDNSNIFKYSESSDTKNINSFKNNKTDNVIHEKDLTQEKVDIKKLLSSIRAEEETFNSSNTKDLSTFREDSNIYRPFEITSLRPIGTIFATYVTAIDEDAFYLIDQHAAHERILFEKLSEQFKSQEKIIQPLLIPLVLELNSSDISMSDEWIPILSKMGFEISEFGGNSIKVAAMPMFMSLKEGEDFLLDFIENYKENTSNDYGKLEKIISNSCKSAIKGNDSLHHEEINALLHSLSLCKNPFSCPHGRPTFLRLSKDYIEKQFKRR